MRARLVSMLGLASLAGMLSACNMLNLDSSGKTQPATEGTVTGTWRNAEPNTEGKTVRMTLRVDDDHTLVWARRVSGVAADGGDLEYQRESCSWRIEAGVLKATKTTCQYANPIESGLADAACKAPVDMDIPIKVNGNAWSIVEDGKPMVFRKD